MASRGGVVEESKFSSKRKEEVVLAAFDRLGAHLLRFGEGEARGRSDEERQHSLWQAQALDLQDVSHGCSVAMISRCMKERDIQMQLWIKLWSCPELYHLRRQVTFDIR